MNEQNYTSLELSKKLAENGCKLESEYWWKDRDNVPQIMNGFMVRNDKTYKDHITNIAPAYDILNDICVKYATSFFGEEFIPHKYTQYLQEGDPVLEVAYKVNSQIILSLLQQNKKQEAERYIEKTCVFFK